MPLQRTETYSAPATTVSWNCDQSITPFNVNVVCLLSNGGTVSYKLQYSYDSLDNPVLNDTNATWIDSNDIPAGTSASAETNFSTPIARVRLVIASLTGTLTMKMLQPMSVN
jgi:hypothetical protein